MGVFLYNITGYYLYFKIKEYQVKHEIKQKIRQNNGIGLSIIRLGKGQSNKILWVKKDKEFVYEGEMYDIVRKEGNENYDIYYCILDSKEKKLLRSFASYLEGKRSDSQHNQSVEKIIKKIFTDYYSLLQVILHDKSNKITLEYTYYPEFYTSIILDVLAPPPRHF